jgi:hypothetical protein
VRQRVLDEAQRFRAALPELLTRLPGRFVVFRDGVVVSDHDSDEEAYIAGIDRFGPYGGQVIGAVREPEAAYIGELF